VKMGVAVAVALARARAVGGDKDNGGNSNGRGPDNNYLKGQAEETMAAAKMMAMETAMAL
jgi:hypothetical protein